jgi:hypothetical protein
VFSRQLWRMCLDVLVSRSDIVIEKVCTILYLPSLMTTVSCPGCFRMWTAIVVVSSIRQVEQDRG